MTENVVPPVMAKKVRRIIQHALRNLDPADLAKRAEWARRHGVPGVIVKPEGESFTFTYGGRVLAVVDAQALTDDDVPLPPPEFVAEGNIQSLWLDVTECTVKDMRALAFALYQFATGSGAGSAAEPVFDALQQLKGLLAGRKLEDRDGDT